MTIQYVHFTNDKKLKIHIFPKSYIICHPYYNISVGVWPSYAWAISGIVNLYLKVKSIIRTVRNNVCNIYPAVSPRYAIRNSQTPLSITTR